MEELLFLLIKRSVCSIHLRFHCVKKKPFDIIHHPICFRWFTWTWGGTKSSWTMTQRFHTTSVWLLLVRILTKKVFVTKCALKQDQSSQSLQLLSSGGVPRNLQVVERAGEEVMTRTTLFRKVSVQPQGGNGLSQARIFCVLARCPLTWFSFWSQRTWQNAKSVK